MKELCELPHGGRLIGAWLCAKAIDRTLEAQHIHVCGSHARRLHPSYKLVAIELGREYRHGVKSGGCQLIQEEIEGKG